MTPESDVSSSRETLRRQIAEDHGFALYKHYPEADAAAFLRLHPVTLKKVRLAGSIRSPANSGSSTWAGARTSSVAAGPNRASSLEK
jgi:hypothetical protein